MKKLAALTLAVSMLLPASAFAEDLPYIRQLEQYDYINNTLLTQESYPEVRLMASYPFRYFGATSSSPKEPLFLCFSGPEGAQPADFNSMWAHYLDMENMIVYDYQLVESDSFEEFINKAEEDEYILLDGSEGAAAYIDPSDYNHTAYGMLYAKDFGKSAKLWIRITLNSLDNKMPMDTRIEQLSDAILAEIDRVSSEMHTELYEPYFWSTGLYAGMKMLDYEYQTLCTFDFPVLVSEVTDRETRETETKQAPFTVTHVEGTTMEGVYGYGGGSYVEFEADLDTYCYALSKLEENDPEAEELTLQDGSSWIFYSGNRNDDGSIYAWRAAKKLDDQTDKDGDPYYLSLYYSGDYVKWADVDACKEVLEEFAAGLRCVSPQEDPYVEPEPAENTGTEAAEAEDVEASVSDDGLDAIFSDAEDTWICPECEAENTGNFCSNCGAAKPEDSTWSCPECGQENDGNFCSNCGTARP